MLHIQLFGSLCVQHTCIDGNKSLLLTSQLASVLAFLALFRGRYFSREELVSELWDESRACDVSQGAFNTALWRLRKRIEKEHYRAGEVIDRDQRGFVCFRKEADVYLDIEEFKSKAQPGLDISVHNLSKQNVAGLNSAVALYQADILGDFDAEWALREREKLRRIYFSVLGKLDSHSRKTRDYDSSIRYAHLILDSEPLREDVHRELMELYELSGQRALALKQFETCRSLLRQELAIPPMPQTMQLYRSIADHAIHPDHYANSDPSVSSLQDFHSIDDNSLHLVNQKKFEPKIADPKVTDKNTATTPHALINQAREHMAIADARLQHSVNLLGKHR